MDTVQPPKGRRQAGRPLRVAYAVYGDPADEATQSGVAANLWRELEGLPRMQVAPVNTFPSRASMAVAAALSPRIGRERWRWATHNGPRMVRARSRRLERWLDDRPEAPDVVLELRASYRPVQLPYVAYLDNTVDLARRLWPASAPWRGPALARLLRYEQDFLRGCSHIFATGSLVADSVVSTYGVSSDAVTVVGAGSHFGAPSLADVDREPWVLFVGRDFERKGGRTLLAAFREVRASFPDARLKIVGPSLRVDEPGIESLGPVSDREALADLYQRSLIFALPVQYEPYGIAYLEAMGHGLACIGTRVGAVPEIITDGKTGVLVDPGDSHELAAALSALLKDRSATDAMGAAGRLKVQETLNWRSVAQRMEPALRSAAAGRSSVY